MDLEHPPVSSEFVWTRRNAQGNVPETPAPYPPVASTSNVPYTPQQPVTSSIPASLASTPNAVAPINRKIYNPAFCGTFEDFLNFAFISPEDRFTRDRLASGGYNHWTSLQAGPDFSAKDLVQTGIPQGQALALIRFAGEFLAHVLECIAYGAWFVPE